MTQPMYYKIKKLINLNQFIFLFLLTCFSSAHSTERNESSQVEGVVDTATIENNEITLQGWVGAFNSKNEAKDIIITLNDKSLYEGTLTAALRMPRPDVNKALGRDDWLTPGWRLTTAIPSSFESGTYRLKVSVKDANGTITPLSLNNNTAEVRYKNPGMLTLITPYAVPLSLIALFLFLLYLFVKVEKITDTINEKFTKQLHPAAILCAAVLFIFTILLSLGITGSSFSVGVKQASFIDSNPSILWGSEKPIRSDEWRVLTPNSIAQANHIPPFPVINSNLGNDGQNMLIIGMTGVPVAHVSQIVKPATWGFYLFDLKRALSWNWLFPIFACLLAVWAVLCALNPGSWRLNFIASLTFSSAAYVVAWSNWPAYTVFFPCLVFLSFIKTLETKNTFKVFGYSCLLGLSFAGFVLVLYPPWQISLTYVFIAITVGKVIKDKSYRSISLLHGGAYIFALAISGLILYMWWHDARDAIHTMESTVYPGLRTTLTGADVALDFLLRGYTNLGTLNTFTSPFTNQSEIASFYYMLLPLMTLFLIKAYRKQLSAVEAALAVAISFILCFMFLGIPKELAEYSLWGRVPGKRADLALGFACLVLTSLLATTKNSTPIKQSNFLAAGSAIIWAVTIYTVTYQQDINILNTLSTSLVLIITATALVAGYLLARGSIRSYFIVMLSLSAFTTYDFNPVVLAPQYVKAKSTALTKEDESNADRVLVLEALTPSMYLLASGTKVVNGIFYYPQTTIWKQLDPASLHSDIYNRYQHLTFHIDNDMKGVQTFLIESPRPDVVKVSLNPETFDFSVLSATKVVAPSSATRLTKNSSLTYISTQDGWAWFKIKNKTM
ncbi:hypothetical protein [Pseudomonas coronafaciens]|uniref:Uncharacterized protein n=1 Tax=Pseudomonas coronafaciens pv. coronafaciens TaxID=235275 RepID=A0AAE6QKP2_9PSED|nr:hypothetical protein [Pseudomonas coronafaciens]QGT83526.1 hypothetical protein GMO17_21330 [Pseudomonas coronafaciens pv. coronafaciens]